MKKRKIAKLAPSDESKKMTAIAVLDEDGVYQGLREIPLNDLAPDHVHLPDGCDLPPGRYKWDADVKAFMPIMKKGKR